ncbi:MAG: VTT domain-containing protein [Clostridia bacterium]|nr:VTT domain-containing protein [Clostridia bacterium]
MFKEDNRLTRVYVIALVLFAVGFGFYLRNRNLLNEVEEFAARNWVLAWLLMLSLYVFRAFVPFLPSFAFYAMSGRIFPGRILPFLVSFSGVALLYILSYLIGLKKHRRVCRTKRSAFFRLSLFDRYRRFRDAFVQQTASMIRNKRMGTLLLFAASPFPKKLFGKICGRIRVSFSIFLTASLLGTLPEMVSVTLLGKSVLDATSPLFYVALVLTVSVTVISVILFQKSSTKEIQYSEKSN